VELLAARAFGKGIGLGCHVEPDVPLMITADPGRVRQVLLNLIGNAIKFTDAGGVLVTIARARAEITDRIRFTVADTGPGLPPGAVDEVFRRGYSTKAGTAERRRGLGLALVAQAVQRAGGSLVVDGPPGAVFTVRLPVGGRGG
jgi:signal transduction histidine kinase